MEVERRSRIRRRRERSMRRWSMGSRTGGIGGAPCIVMSSVHWEEHKFAVKKALSNQLKTIFSSSFGQDEV